MIEIVDLLTHDKDGMSYDDYIQKIVDSGHASAIMIKIADNEDNSCPDRWDRVTDVRLRDLILPKYKKALPLLQEALEGVNDSNLPVVRHGEPGFVL